MYTFQWNGSAWIEDSVVLRPSGISSQNNFGRSVFIDNNHMAVGCWASVDVYTFYWNGSIWEQDSTTLSPPGITTTDKYGAGTISISGDKLAVGAYEYDNTAINAGVVYTYKG